MQQLRILHTADLHLGFRQYGLGLREGDFYNAAQQVFMKAVELKVDAILISGDLFDATKPPALAVKIMQALVAMVKKLGIRVLAIDGNHDVSGGNWLEICGIEHIGGKSITLASPDGNTLLHVGGIDSCRPGVFYQTLNKMAEDGPIEILAIHQAVAELCDFPKTDYSALQMATMLRPIGVKYVAMGDIHVYRETVIGDIRFAYPGSTEMNAIDEPPEKQVSLVMWDGTAIATAIIPIPTRPFMVRSFETEADVDLLLAAVATSKVPPVVVGWYTAKNRDLAKRAESVLQSVGCMYRIMPYSGKAKDGKPAAIYERGQAMMELKDAVAAYFEEGSDEFQLVFQLLDNPDNVKDTVTAYLKSKGL